MISRTFLIINSEKEIDPICNAYLLFGSMDIDYFKTCVSKSFPQTNWNNNEIGVLKTGNAVIEFYVDNIAEAEEVNTGAIADVKFSDEPTLEVKQICLTNNWLLFDIDFEEYIPLR